MDLPTTAGMAVTKEAMGRSGSEVLTKTGMLESADITDEMERRMNAIVRKGLRVRKRVIRPTGVGAAERSQSLSARCVEAQPTCPPNRPSFTIAPPCPPSAQPNLRPHRRRHRRLALRVCALRIRCCSLLCFGRQLLAPLCCCSPALLHPLPGIWRATPLQHTQRTTHNAQRNTPRQNRPGPAKTGGTRGDPTWARRSTTCSRTGD